MGVLGSNGGPGADPPLLPPMGGAGPRGVPRPAAVRSAMGTESGGSVLDTSSSSAPSDLKKSLLSFSVERILSDKLGAPRVSRAGSTRVSPILAAVGQPGHPELHPLCLVQEQDLLWRRGGSVEWLEECGGVPGGSGGTCCWLGGPQLGSRRLCSASPEVYLSRGPLLSLPRPIRPLPTKFQLKVSYERLARSGDQPQLGEEGTCRPPAGKRKRSWSRAVFSSLQRRGLEKRFQLQQYITKPDRRQLAASLGLTDAQVKVWFQNRRMKWRHTKETKGSEVPSQQRISASQHIL